MAQGKRRPSAGVIIGVLAGIATIVATCIAIFSLNIDIAAFLNNLTSGAKQSQVQGESVGLQKTALVLQKTEVSSQREAVSVQKTLQGLQATSLAPGSAGGKKVAEQISGLEATQSTLTALQSSVKATLTAIPPKVAATRSSLVGAVSTQASQVENATVIPFAAADNSGTLSAAWVAYQGKPDDKRLEANDIRLTENGATLNLVAGPGTNNENGNNTAPQVSYPLSGNFTAQVKVTFRGQGRYHVIGFGLRPRDAEGQWIALRRYSDGPNNGYLDIEETQNNSTRQLPNTRMPYLKDDSYIRIQRQEEQVSFWVSENGKNWFPVLTTYVFSLPQDVFGFLYLWSSDPTGATGQFRDFRLLDHDTPPALAYNGPVSFADPAAPDQLAGAFGWFPGGSRSNFQKVADGKLSLICGINTNNEQGNNNAPAVFLPVSGNFEAQVRLDFKPSERHQVAGFGITENTKSQKWLVLRRWADSAQGQYFGVEQSLDFNARDIQHVDYKDTTIYLKVVRAEPLISLYSSPDGQTWTPQQEGFVMDFPEQVFLYFYCWSTSQTGIQANFSDLQVMQK